MKRLLNIGRLFLLTEATDAYNEAKESLRLTLNLVATAVATPLVLIGIGTAIGVAGFDQTAHGFNVAAGFVGALFLTLVWVRAVTFACIAYFLARGVKAASVGTINIADDIEVGHFAKWLRGVTAWASGVCLYAQLVPTWKDLGASVVAATCIMIIAAIMSSGWFGASVVTKYAFVGFVGIVFLYSTLTLVSPKFERAMEKAKAEYLGTDDFGKASKTDEAKPLDEPAYAPVAATQKAKKAANGTPAVVDLPPPPPVPVTAAAPTEFPPPATTAAEPQKIAPPSSGTKEKARKRICRAYPELCR